MQSLRLVVASSWGVAMSETSISHAHISLDLLLTLKRPETTERVAIKDRASWLALRQKDVTASQVGALFGEHEYVTMLDLWQQKAGVTTGTVEDNPAMRRGRLLEPVAFQLLADERPDWSILPMQDQFYFRDRLARIGATPDGIAVRPDKPSFGIVQVKTTDSLTFRRKWKPDEHGGEINVPTWIGLQALTEMRLTGAAWASVVLLVVGHGLDIHVVDVEEPEGLWALTQGHVRDFWHSIENNRMPDPDFDRDAKRVVEHYSRKSGETVDLSGDNRIIELVDERARLKAVEAAGSAAEKARKPIEAEIVAKMAHASHATLADGRTITVKTITVNKNPQPASTFSYPKFSIEGTAP